MSYSGGSSCGLKMEIQLKKSWTVGSHPLTQVCHILRQKILDFYCFLTVTDYSQFMVDSLSSHATNNVQCSIFCIHIPRTLLFGALYVSRVTLASIADNTELICTHRSQQIVPSTLISGEMPQILAQMSTTRTETAAK